MPRATRCLEGIRALIAELEAKGAAYSAEGDVYFAVMKHAGYGKLSGRDLADQQTNADGRVADAEEARKIHYGEAEPEGMYGEVSETEREQLDEEGIEIMQMPWLPPDEWSG